MLPLDFLLDHLFRKPLKSLDGSGSTRSPRSFTADRLSLELRTAMGIASVVCVTLFSSSTWFTTPTLVPACIVGLQLGLTGSCTTSVTITMGINWHCDTDTPLKLSDDLLQLLQQFSNRLVFHGQELHAPRAKNFFKQKRWLLKKNWSLTMCPYWNHKGHVDAIQCTEPCWNLAAHMQIPQRSTQATMPSTDYFSPAPGTNLAGPENRVEQCGLV